MTVSAQGCHCWSFVSARCSLDSGAAAYAANARRVAPMGRGGHSFRSVGSGQVIYEENLLKHQDLQKNVKRNNHSRVSDIELNSVDAEKENKMSQNNFFEVVPLELYLRIFSQLDIQSLCRASMTCKSWNHRIKTTDSLWEPHCLAVRAVCKREIDDDLNSGYSCRDTLLRNYQKSQVKLDWLCGRYSNIRSHIGLPEKIMYPMDAETWGEILEAELKRYVQKSQAELIPLRI